MPQLHLYPTKRVNKLTDEELGVIWDKRQEFGDMFDDTVYIVNDLGHGLDSVGNITDKNGNYLGKINI